MLPSLCTWGSLGGESCTLSRVSLAGRARPGSPICLGGAEEAAVRSMAALLLLLLMQSEAAYRVSVGGNSPPLPCWRIAGGWTAGETPEQAWPGLLGSKSHCA